MSDGIRKVSDGVRKVSDGDRKLSDGVRKVSGRCQGLKKDLGRCHMVS